jgi:hypothetical protein
MTSGMTVRKRLWPNDLLEGLRNATTILSYDKQCFDLESSPIHPQYECTGASEVGIDRFSDLFPKLEAKSPSATWTSPRTALPILRAEVSAQTQ